MQKIKDMPLGIFSFLNLTLVDVLDIACIALLIFFLIRWLKGSAGMNIFVAIVILVAVRILVGAVGMKMTSALLGGILDVGAIAIIVIFQPEIRRFLSNMGRHAGDTLEKRSFLERLLGKKPGSDLSSESIKEICEACREMAEQKTGALIVIRRDSPLNDIVSTGDIVDAHISRRLIMNIFYKNSPLHDGAMIIGGDRIIAARCTLPMTERRDIPANFGMRHKSAIGISEQSNADVIVVSEQTGKISFVKSGKLSGIDNISALMLVLEDKNKQ